MPARRRSSASRVAVYYWTQTPDARSSRTRSPTELVQGHLAEPEGGHELAPSVVIVDDASFATVFFALMDRFWGFVTNLVYGDGS